MLGKAVWSRITLDSDDALARYGASWRTSAAAVLTHVRFLEKCVQLYVLPDRCQRNDGNDEEIKICNASKLLIQALHVLPLLHPPQLALTGNKKYSQRTCHGRGSRQEAS